MCIRDRIHFVQIDIADDDVSHLQNPDILQAIAMTCLLYTSDAADERSSVDLGGRRIIKKNTTTNRGGDRDIQQNRT